MIRISTLLLVLFCFLFTSNAQENVKRCALDDIIQQQVMDNPSLYTSYFQQINNGVNRIFAYDSSLANTDSVYTVQVVFHIVYLNDNKYENIPDDICQSQIDVLNTIYNAQNADSVNLRPFFIPFRGNAKIKFELAKTAPNGRTTNGITRTLGKLGSLSGWDPISTLIWTALGIEPLKEDFFLLTGSTGKSPWPASKYLNIYVCDLNYANRKCRTCLTLCDTCGALGGFAYPPSNAINWGPLALDHGKNDGIVIDFRFFGANNWYARDSTSQRFRDFYSGGKSTAHEVGHYFGLQHQWGNVVNLPGLPVTDGCTVDDFMDDTPEEEQAFANNLQHGFTNPCDSSINTCTKDYLGRDWPDMYEDYMDYSTDLCYNLFTKQQVNMMRYNLITRRPGIITKRELAPSVPTALHTSKFKDAGISFYPNPVSDLLTIHADRIINKDLTIDIMDVSGKIVSSEIMKANTFDQQIDVKSLSNGVYLVKFHNDEFTATDKFMKR
jgi:hypothetical protein